MWVRGDCYEFSDSPTTTAAATTTTTTSNSSTDTIIVHCTKHNAAATTTTTNRCCPLHKHIRNRSWTDQVLPLIKKDPSLIMITNRVGWSSLILAIYHCAPVDVIAEMLALVTNKERINLLSTPVPNGSRLCLHFVARFSDNLEVYKLITEPYPKALVVMSDDGNKPYDRALYYRKNNDILQYLETSTKREMVHVQNIKLRQVVLECCHKYWLLSSSSVSSSSSLPVLSSKFQQQQKQQLLLLQETTTRRNNNNNNNNNNSISTDDDDEEEEVVVVVEEEINFIVNLYSYLREREMDGIFKEILSFIGNRYLFE